MVPPQADADKGIAKRFSDSLLQLLSDEDYTPLDEKGLFAALEIPKKFHTICRQVLTDLIQNEQITIKKNLFSLKQASPPSNIMVGVLHTHPRGFGFVKVDASYNIPDLFIPKDQVGGAIDGDLVEVELFPGRRSDRGPEGKIRAILKTKHKILAGVVCEIGPFPHCFLPLLGVAKLIEVVCPPKVKLAMGDRILVELLPQQDKKENPKGKFLDRIGNIENPTLDVPAAIAEFALPAMFPKEVIAEAESFGREVKPSEGKERIDFTQEVSITIDPTTARDFDDALSLRREENGDYSLAVHIADVAHYVEPGSALDEEAFTRANSTYFPGYCVPMLPEALSNELCSLKPDVIRLTMTVLMFFDSEGNLKASAIERTRIKSVKRFTYEEAKLVLDGQLESPHKALLELMVELCLLLKKKRIERGSVDLAMPDISVEVDEHGAPVGMRKSEYDITHQLVEEFMLKANEMVATHLDKRGALIFRIHEEPSQEDLSGFCDYVRMLGFALPKTPSLKEIQQVFELAQSHPSAYQIATKYIRTMKMACYSPENVGHFGLSLSHYCHFTSPIRRYSDLIIQRLLFDSSAEDFDLEEISQHVSDRERVSMRAEGHVKLLKKFRLLEKWHLEDRSISYKATIVGIKPMGLIFEIDDLFLEGYFHVSELEEDFFHYNERAALLQGERTGKQYRVGDWITVNLVSLDLILLKARWSLVTPKEKEKVDEAPFLLP